MNNNFLSSPLFNKIKEILKITGDKEFFKLMTTHLVATNYLKYETNLLDYYTDLINTGIIEKSELVDIYLDGIKHIQDLYSDNYSTILVHGEAFLNTDLYYKIEDIISQTGDKEFFKLITNYLIEAECLSEEDNLAWYLSSLGIKRIITKEDVCDWYLSTINPKDFKVVVSSI